MQVIPNQPVNPNQQAQFQQQYQQPYQSAQQQQQQIPNGVGVNAAGNISFAQQANDILDGIFQLGKEKNKMDQQQMYQQMLQQQAAANGSFLDTTLGKVALVGGGGLLGAFACKMLSKGGGINSQDLSNLADATSTLSQAGVGDIVSALFNK
jgi:hypothetical protein